jgi:hypothetical protein
MRDKKDFEVIHDFEKRKRCSRTEILSFVRSMETNKTSEKNVFYKDVVEALLVVVVVEKLLFLYLFFFSPFTA